MEIQFQVMQQGELMEMVEMVAQMLECIQLAVVVQDGLQVVAMA
ncbi:hypothetical protein [Nibribacter koreensis]